jgi:hypothetical protein
VGVVCQTVVELPGLGRSQIALLSLSLLIAALMRFHLRNGLAAQRDCF